MSIKSLLLWKNKESSVEADNKRRKELGEWLAKSYYADEEWAKRAVASLSEDWTAEERAQAAAQYAADEVAYEVSCRLD